MDFLGSEERRRPRKSIYEQDSYEGLLSSRQMTMSDRIYEERLATLKEAYDRRLSSLSEHVQQFFTESVGDEIYKTMKESKVSSGYAKDRLKEILFDCMSVEAEATIAELQNALAVAKLESRRFETEHQRNLGNCSKLEDNLKGEIERNARLTADLRDLTANSDEKLRQKEQEWTGQLKELKAKLQQARSTNERLTEKEAEVFKMTQQTDSLKNELERTRTSLSSYEEHFTQVKHEAQELNAALTQAEAILQDRDQEIHDLKRRKAKLKEAYEHLNSEAQQLASDRDNLVEKCTSFEKEVYTTLQQEQKASFDKSRRYKNKFKQLKRRLTENIEYVGQLEAKLQEAQRNHQETEGGLKGAYDSLQATLQSERDQWRKRLSESASEASMKEADLTSKHSLQIGALQTQYQKMLDSRVADMQRDMESQISRSKKLDEELHAIMEDRLRELEHDTISKLKHESILNEKLREANQQYTELAQTLRAQLEKSNLEASTQAQRELASMRQDWERQRAERDEKLADLRVLKTRLTEELTEVRRESALLTDELARARAELETLRNNKGNLKRELIDLQGAHQAQAKELEATKVQLSKLLIDKEHLELKCNDTREELERKTGQLHRTETHFETTFKKLADDHQSTEKLKRQRLNELEEEVQTLSKAKSELETQLSQANRRVGDLQVLLQDAQNTEQKRQDADLETIIEGRNRIVKMECITQQLEDEKTHLASRITDLKAALKAADTETLSLRNRLAESEGQLSDAHGELSEYIKAQSQLKSKLGNLSTQAKAAVTLRARDLKKQLNIMKTSVDNELTGTLKHVSHMFEAVLNKFIEISDQHKTQYEAKAAENASGLTKTWKHKLHKAEKELTTQTQGIIRGLEDKAVSLERTVSELQMTRLELLETLEEERMTVKHYKHENERLEEMLKQNSNAFDLLSAEVHQETDYIRRQADSQIERTKDELKEKHEAEVLQFQAKISDLQHEISRLQTLGTEKLVQLKAEQTDDLRAARQKYEDRIAQLEKQVEVEKQRKGVLLTTAESLEEDLQDLKKEHQAAIAGLQEQLKREKHDKILEVERLLNYRSDAVREIESLTKRLADQQRETDEKTEQASRLARENREQFNTIKDLENRYDMQARELVYLKPSVDYNEHSKLGKAELDYSDYRKSRGSYRS